MGRFGLDQVSFGSGGLWANRFLVQYSYHAKISNFAKIFGSGIVQFESIRVSGSLLDEPISDVGSGMGSDRSVRISGVESILPDLPTMRSG